MKNTLPFPIDMRPPMGVLAAPGIGRQRLRILIATRSFQSLTVPAALWIVFLTGCVGIPHKKDIATGYGVETVKPRLASVQEHVTTRKELQELVGHFQTDASYGRFFWARWQQVKLQIDSVGLSGLGADRFWKIVNVLAIFDESDRIAKYRVCSEWTLVECLRDMIESAPEPPPNASDPLPLNTTSSRSTRREAYGRLVIADARVYVEELEGGRFSLPLTAVTGVTLHQYSSPETLEVRLHFHKATAPSETGMLTISPAQAVRLIWLLQPAHAVARRPGGARDLAVAGGIVAKKPRLADFRQGATSRAELEEAVGQFKTKASYDRFFWARWQERDDPESDRYWKIMNLVAVFDDQDRAARYRLCSERELPEYLHALAQSLPPPPGAEQALALSTTPNLRRWQPRSRWKNNEFEGRLTVENSQFVLRNVLGDIDRAPATAVDQVAAHDTYSSPETLQWKLHFSDNVKQRQTAPISLSPEQASRLVWVLRFAPDSGFRSAAGH
jgi:hypothetical protein